MHQTALPFFEVWWHNKHSDCIRLYSDNVSDAYDFNVSNSNPAFITRHLQLTNTNTGNLLVMDNRCLDIRSGCKIIYYLLLGSEPIFDAVALLNAIVNPWKTSRIGDDVVILTSFEQLANDGIAPARSRSS